jgi:hypothetical protein
MINPLLSLHYAKTVELQRLAVGHHRRSVSRKRGF